MMIRYSTFLNELTGGWNAGLHAVLEVFGIAGRWRRAPYASVSDSELQRLTDFLDNLGVRP